MAERVTNRSRSARARTPGTRATRPAQVRVPEPREDELPDRYRPRARRTEAEPLEASWRPEPQDGPPPRGRPRKGPAGPSGLGKLVGRYGWRIYALPVLLVITVIALFDARGGAQDEQAAPPEGTPAVGSGPAAPEDPSATENPPDQVNLKIPTAELPGGGEYTTRGDGKWHIVKGDSAPVGKGGGELYKYTVEVEDGIDQASYGGDSAFGDIVEGTLSDPRSWTGDGKVQFQRVDSRSEADFFVSLTTPATAHKPDICGFTIKYESSCYRRSMDRVIINLARFVRGAKAFNSDMTAYRQYAINHEVGHALNNSHVGCGRNGALAPVMMQQTFGVANNYVAKLNRADPTNYAAVAKDGKVCKPNAWPNPGAE